LGLKVPIVELPYYTSRWKGQRNESSQSAGNAPYFLFVGRLEKIKGLQTIIPLFRRYNKAQLWIIGEGNYTPVLRRLARGSPNIKFLGHQSGDQLRVLYKQAVAILVPSIWYEVFGIVILEAFAQKTPALVRNIGGMPKIIEESRGGFVFDTEQELLTAMDLLVEDPRLRQKVGQRGYEALQQKWSADVHIRHYLEHVEQVLVGRK
jgi:glycosyltransferase involved in cell wall biosynthesis